MDESVEVNISDITSPTSNMAAASSILGAVKRIIGFFVLSEEEKLQAGIDVDNFHERHDARQKSGWADSSDDFQSGGRIG
jgi:hypothetical protein